MNIIEQYKVKSIKLTLNCLLFCTISTLLQFFGSFATNVIQLSPLLIGFLVLVVVETSLICYCKVKPEFIESSNSKK